MTLQDQLDVFAREPACAGLVAFGDLASGLILKWHATPPRPREVMDRLGQTAHLGFAMFDPDLVPAPGGAVALVAFGVDSLQLFARSSLEPGDFLAAECLPGSAIGPVLADLSTLADQCAGAT